MSFSIKVIILDILYLLVPITLGLITLAVILFYWTVKSGQYDDLDSQAYRILFDDENDKKMTPPESIIKESKVKTSDTAQKAQSQDSKKDSANDQ